MYIKKIVNHHLFVLFISIMFLFSFGFSQNKIKQSQRDSWTTFRIENNNKGKIRWNIKTGTVVSLYGIKTKAYPGDAIQAAKSFLIENHQMLGLTTDINDLKYEKQINLNQTKHIGFKQYYMDVPVYTGEYFVHMDETNQVMAVNGNYYTGIDINVNPKISKEQAIRTAIEEIGFQQPTKSNP
jgi:Zn-dependent metalloprotease